MNPESVSGVELARLFYEEAVRPLMAGRAHAAARLGSGSEVLGFDTCRSTDHGWGPQLHVFVAEVEVEETRALIDVGLPEEFRGWPVRFGWDAVAVQHHVGVSTLAVWFDAHLGFDPQGEIAPRTWLATPQQLLLEATEGAVFSDSDGALGRARRKLSWYPDDIWLWLLACQWRRIGQEEAFVGRTAEVGDELGSRVLTARLVRDVIRLCFLQERRYAPYGKWLGSAFQALSSASEIGPHLTAAAEAPDFPAREAALSRAYESAARRHNALGMTAVVDPDVRGYYGRPFLVIGGDRFADACVERIGDEWLKRQSLVGGIDQFVDSTDILSSASRAKRVANQYDDE